MLLYSMDLCVATAPLTLSTRPTVGELVSNFISQFSSLTTSWDTVTKRHSPWFPRWNTKFIFVNFILLELWKIEMFRSLWVNLFLSVLTFTSTWALFHFQPGYSNFLSGLATFLPRRLFPQPRRNPSYLPIFPRLPLEDTWLHEGLQIW